jgi:hypothetical protein
VAGLLATQARHSQYAEARDVELHPEAVELTFYQEFSAYVINLLGQSVSTFAKHMDQFKTFLTWCEQELDLPVRRYYLRFVAPRKRGRAHRSRAAPGSRPQLSGR